MSNLPLSAFRPCNDTAPLAATDPLLADDHHSAPTRRQDFFELAIGYALILLVIWTPAPIQRPLYWLATAFILVISWRSFAGWRAMGLRRTNLLRSLWIAALALLGAAAAILAALHLHTLRPWQGSTELLHRFWGYALWAFFQQFLLQIFFLERLLRLVASRPLAIALAAGLFAVAHLPSPILTVVTLVFGLASCALFLRYRNLIPLALSHAILGITIAISFPGAVTHNMRVGLSYLAYRPRQGHHHHSSPHVPALDAPLPASSQP